MSNKYLRKNMGTVDRVIRVLTGLSMLYLGFIDQSIIGNTTIAYIVGFIGVASIIGAFLAICPVYTWANVSTNGSTEESNSSD